MNGSNNKNVPLATPFTFTANNTTFESILEDLLKNTAYFQDISYIFSSHDEALRQADSLTRILFAHSNYEPQVFANYAQETAEQLQSLSNVLTAYNIENTLPDQIDDWPTGYDEYAYDDFPKFHTQLNSYDTIRGNLLNELDMHSEEQNLSEEYIQIFNSTELRFLSAAIYTISDQISNFPEQYENEIIERGLLFPDGGESALTTWLSGIAMFLLGVCAVAMYAAGIPVPPQLAFGIPLILAGLGKIARSGYVSKRIRFGSPPIQPIERRNLSAKLDSMVGIVPAGASSLEILERYYSWGFPKIAQTPGYLAIYVGKPVSSIKYIGEIKIYLTHLVCTILILFEILPVLIKVESSSNSSRILFTN
jgi:hypothetical protein